MNTDSIHRLTAVQLAAAVRTRKLSPVEIVEAFLARIQQVNPTINAYCTVAAEQARAAAKGAESAVIRGDALGPLHGVPVSIKDSIYTAGIRTTIGSKLYENYVPEQDAVVVERLKRAGAIILGKTNTPEFCLMGITDNKLFGVTRNPWNTDYVPGGSSGGAAAATAAELCPIAIGSDGGGSIRVPGSFCGVFGLKPSFGRVPQYPNFPGWDTTGIITTGPLTRTVADAALAMDVIAGRDDRDMTSLPDVVLNYCASYKNGIRGIRVAYSPNLGYARVDPRVDRVVAEAVQVFGTLDCHVEEADPPGFSVLGPYFTIVGVAHAAALREIVKARRAELHPCVPYFVEITQDMTATQYGNARISQTRYWEDIRPFFDKYDLLLTPTVAVPPFRVGEREIAILPSYEGIRVDWDRTEDWLPFTYPFNMTGQPAATVPCGFTDDGLPIGLQIVGRRFAESTVLRAAAAFEQASPWGEKRPAL